MKIAGGAQYPDELLTQLDAAAIVLAIIGTDWLTATGDYGLRRIDDETDWVRRELRTALAAGSDVTVIPVLIDDASLPPEADAPRALPPDVVQVAFLQAITIRNDHWDHDLQPLAARVAELTGWPQSTRGPAPATSPSAPRLFGRPPIVVDNFQDRSKYLRSIEDADDAVLCAVHGIGGVGKSQLAALYFETNQQRYGSAVWIDMRDEGGRTAMTQLALALGVNQPGIDPVDSAHNHIKDASATWLMVFDNADNPEQVQAIRPTGVHIKSIVTSRWRNWHGFGTAIDIPVFDPDTAVAYLTATTGLPADDDAKTLVAELGHLPLAIGLAGAYVVNRRLTYSRYRKRLPAGLVDALSPRTPGTYDRGIELLWTESLDSAEATNPNCRHLIELLSVLDWTSISRNWLDDRHPLDPAEIEDALVILAAYSLLEFDSERITITHNLIADGIASTVGQRSTTRTCSPSFRAPSAHEARQSKSCRPPRSPSATSAISPDPTPTFLTRTSSARSGTPYSRSSTWEPEIPPCT